jgi:radical SAM protein with 4Fe4S-binding SPASM domain
MGLVSYKMRDSQSVDFLNKGTSELDTIIKTLLNDNVLDPNLRNDILENIEAIIGPHESDWISRNGKEHLVDYIVSRYKFQRYPKMKRLESFPFHLLIEPTSICNLRCIMCFQSDHSFNTKEYMGMIDFGMFKDLVSQAVENNCKFLTLASRGEPTLHKEFGKMLEYCKGKFLELKINTNATRLSKELSREILEAGVNVVVFSVDSFCKEEYERIRVGGDFGEVLGNIRQFCEMRLSKAKYHKTSTRVSGVFIDDRQSKARFLGFWKDIVDTVIFSNVVPRWDTYNNSSMGYNKPCELLWERMYIWYDGTCNPCDFDYKSKMKVGNVKDASIRDIWLGKEYNHYRKMFLEGNRDQIRPCNRCNVY